MKRKDQIAKILREFDFERVHTVMVALDWKWALTGMQVPSVPCLSEHAKRLLDVAWGKAKERGWEERVGIGCGGFEAVCWGKRLSLSFVLASWDIE